LSVLWGREPELATLTGLLDRLPERGGALVLHGEAGVGKSALLSVASAAAAGRGIRVLSAKGVQAEFHIPFAGIQTLLRPLAGSWLLPPTDADRIDDIGTYQLAMRALDLLTEQPSTESVLLCVDDAQWLDSQSWEVLAFVGRRLDADPIALVATMRDGKQSAARLANAQLPTLAVAPLAAEHASSLLEQSAPGLPAGLRGRVLTQAAGNPLGLLELASVAQRRGETGLLPAWLPLTTRLEHAFGAQIRDLPPASRTLLLVAALNDGEALDEALAAGALIEASVTLDDLQPAIAGSAVDVTDTFRIQFRHPLLRSAIRQAAGPSQRREAHAALAETITSPDRRTWHRAAATFGTDDDVARALADVAARAYRRGDLAAAATAWERAAQLTDVSVDRAWWSLRAARSTIDVGDREALQRLVESLDKHLLTPAQHARLSWLREAHLGAGWSGAAKLVPLAEIAEQMRQHGDTDEALESLVSISIRYWWTDTDQQSRSAILAVGDRLEGAELEPRLVSLRALVDPIGCGADSLRKLAALQRRFDLEPSQLHLLGTAASAVGALPAAALFLTGAVAGLRQQGRISTLAQALNSQAYTAVQNGDTVLALTAAEEARALAAETGQHAWVLTADLSYAQALALRGDHVAANAAADRCAAVLTSMGAYRMLAIVQTARGLACLAAGRHAAAADQFGQVFDPASVAYHPYLRFALVGLLAEAIARSENRDALHAAVEELTPVAARSETPVLRSGLAYARAVLADDDEAEELYLAALAPEFAWWPFERARVQLAYGSWLRRQHRSVDCRPVLRAAVAAFDALGIVPWADQARKELRASGEAVPRSDDARLLLTPQELQISQLAAAGLSNREIGARLFLSPRTVSTHLYRIYPKIGVASRNELARLVGAELAPGPPVA
jgi:DNA-binding CsgD family transcriptional regulator